ncbi:hypothetical protein PLCT2_00814 [Planctomycetaceae bacterium]|nr:hypothetical protein PLCT2_00814 [Planctomycetaceae bacterium]
MNNGKGDCGCGSAANEISHNMNEDEDFQEGAELQEDEEVADTMESIPETVLFPTTLGQVHVPGIGRVIGSGR